MILLFGRYQFNRKRIAYRNDFCLSCEEQRVAEKHRTFDMGHVFFVPILPLGNHDRWHCTQCGNNPHARVRTSRTLLIVFAVAVGLFTIVTWTGPFLPPSESAIMIWSMRLIFTLGFIALVLGLRKKEPEVGLAEKLSHVVPLSMDQCARCGNGLRSDGFCAMCLMHHVPLPNANAQVAPPIIVK